MGDKQVPATPTVHTVVDERENAIRQKALDKVTKALQTEDRKGNHPTDPRQNPLFKKWNDALKSPFAPVLPEFDRRSERRGLAASVIVAGFLASEQFEHFTKRNQKSSGSFSIDGASWGRLNVEKLGDTTIVKAASIGDVADLRNVLASEYLQEITPLPERPLRVRDLFDVQETDAGAIHFIRETGFTENAAPVPENVDPASATASAQSTITYDQITRTVRTLMHHMKLPLQLLDDVPSLQAELERRMNAGLLDEEDGQLLNGDGTGNNLNGLLTDGNIQTDTWAAGDPGDNQADAVLNAIAKAWVGLYAPDGNVMHPTRWSKILKLKDDNGGYLVPEAHRSTMTPALWGIPIALTIAIATNLCCPGAYRTGATVYDRMLASIYASRENEDDLLKNIVTVVNMERLALAVKRPEAFVKLTFDSAP